MQIELQSHNTHVVLSDEACNRGILQLVVADREIPFLLPALAGQFCLKDAWPHACNAMDAEPQRAPASLTQVTNCSALLYQPAMDHTCVETLVHYEIVCPGGLDVTIITTSHARSYPHGYVGLFWSTIIPPGGQEGFYALAAGGDGEHQWHHVAGGARGSSRGINTFADAGASEKPQDQRLATRYSLEKMEPCCCLPILVSHWQDLYYSLALDTMEISLTNVLLDAAARGMSWDLYWRLRAGQSRTIRCRLTVGRWPGWQAVERQVASWPDYCRWPRPMGTAGQARSAARMRPVAVIFRQNPDLVLPRCLLEGRKRPNVSAPEQAGRLTALFDDAMPDECRSGQ